MSERSRLGRRWQRLPGRRGYSLISMLMSIAIISLALTSVAIAMHAMYGVDRRLRDQVAYEQTVPRLSLRLRRDAHAAGGVRLGEGTDGPDRLILEYDAEQVEYRAEAGRIVRTRRSLDEQSANVVLGREVYSLGEQTDMRWHVVNGAVPRLELEIRRPAGRIDSADALQVDRIVAAVGLHANRRTATRQAAPGGSDAANE